MYGVGLFIPVGQAIHTKLLDFFFFLLILLILYRIIKRFTNEWTLIQFSIFWMKLVKETTAVRGKSRLGLFPQIYTEIKFPFLTLQGVWQAALLSRISLNSTNLSPIWKGVNQMNMNQFLSHEWFHTALSLPKSWKSILIRPFWQGRGIILSTLLIYFWMFYWPFPRNFH